MTELTKQDLSGYVPDKETFYNHYEPRPMPSKRFPNDLAVLEGCVKGIELDGRLRYYNVMLMGPTGAGKTAAYMALCAKNQWPIISVNCNGMTTVEDLIGQLMPKEHDRSSFDDLIEPIIEARMRLLQVKARTDIDNEEKNRLFMQATADQMRAEYKLQLAMQTAEFEWVPGKAIMSALGDPNFEFNVLLLDELNMAPPRIMAVINSLIDDRRSIAITGRGLVQAHRGMHVTSAYNPGYQDTKPLNAALASRFPVKMFYDYQPELEKKLTGDEQLVNFAQKARAARHQVETPTSTRMLLQHSELRRVFGERWAMDNLLANYDSVESQALQQPAELYMQSAKSTGQGGGRAPVV